MKANGDTQECSGNPEAPDSELEIRGVPATYNLASGATGIAVKLREKILSKYYHNL
jgi:hypothetical protein